MGQNGQEDSLIAAFNKRFNRRAWEQGKEVVAVATDGQDRHILADFVFGDEALWTLVEFKSWSTSGRTAEDRKEKSQALCTELDAPSTVRRLHDQVHFAGFGVDTGLFFQIYRKHFCMRTFSGAVNDAEFLNAFYNRQIGLDPDDADYYIRWLLDLDDGSGGGSGGGRELRLLIDTGDGKVANKPFSSARAASEWIESIKPFRSGPTPPSGSGSAPSA